MESKYDAMCRWLDGSHIATLLHETTMVTED
jgi:hypothetical protein